MTLVRFKGRNHPQQVRRNGAREEIDERATTPEMFAALERRFRFTIDACATARNTKCVRYWSPAEDGLAQDWTGERVFCNPPYSSIEPWVAKANESPNAELIVMLLPANRTEQPWWQRLVEPRRDLSDGIRCEFLPGRPRFICFGETEVLPNQRPPFGCCLLIWAPRSGAAIPHTAPLGATSPKQEP